MKKTLKQLMVCIVFVLILGGCQTEEQEVRLSSGSVGGTYYPIGGAIAQMLSDHLEGYSFTSYIGNEPLANTSLIREHMTDTALVQNNVAYWAYMGEGTFSNEPVKNLRGIASLYSEVIHIVVNKDSDISSIYDLNNKKINIGQFESGTYIDAISILEAADIKSYEEYNYSFTEAFEAMGKGELDCVFITAGFPTSTVTSLSSQLDTKLLSIPQDVCDKVLEVHDLYAKVIIPTGTYPGTDGEINSLAARALWVCDAELSEQLVYDMTKALWENSIEIAIAHEKGKDILLVNALKGMSIPVHKGALHYYEELNLFQIGGE